MMKHANQGFQWREWFRELKSFVMRDLQDYRREDYLQLSVASRRILLLLITPLIVLLLLFLWRYFWGSNLLKKHDQDIARLIEQTQVLSSDIRDYEQFVYSDFTQKVSKEALFINHDQAALSESALIRQVESFALAEDIVILSLKPYKRVATLNQTSRKSNRSRADAENHIMESLIPRLEIISQTEALGYLRSQGVEKGSFQGDIPLLELGVRICADTASVLTFLDSIAQSLLQSSILFYLEEMQLRDTSNSCLTREYQLLLQFYDLNSLHQLYQRVSEKEGNGKLYQYPDDLKSIAQYIPLFERRKNPTDQGLDSIAQLFSTTQDLEDRNIFEGALPDKGDLYYWHLGERYQEMLLLGIVLRGSDSFAIVKRGKNHWDSLSLMDTNVVEITNDYIVILKEK